MKQLFILFAVFALACGGSVTRDENGNQTVYTDVVSNGTGGSSADSTPETVGEAGSSSVDVIESAVDAQYLSDPHAIVIPCACIGRDGIQARMSSGEFGPCDCNAELQSDEEEMIASELQVIASSATVSVDERTTELFRSYCPRGAYQKAVGFMVTPGGHAATLKSVTIHHGGTGPVEDVLDMSIAYVRYDGDAWGFSVSNAVDVNSNVMRVPFQNGAHIPSNEEGYFFVRVSFNATPGDTHSFSVEDVEFEGETESQGDLPISGPALPVLTYELCSDTAP